MMRTDPAVAGEDRSLINIYLLYENLFQPMLGCHASMPKKESEKREEKERDRGTYGEIPNPILSN